MEPAPFLAFTSDSDSATILRQFVLARGWGDGVIHTGDIDTATHYLKNNRSPQVLCVDIASAESAPASLDALADVCDPGIRVIISGKVNEYSFYCWLTEVGMAAYLLKPFTLAALSAAYDKAADVAVSPVTAPAAEPKKDAEIIAIIGARGGSGATTVCVNLAWLLGNYFKRKTAILDFDPQLGTVALSLDLEAGRGLRDALEKPDRIDGLFMDRVMVRLDDNLSILSTEEGMEENLIGSEAAAEALFKQTRPKFSHIVIDVPRTLTPFTRYALKHADHVVCVTELSIMGLRESLRYLEYCRDGLKVKPPVFVANKTGLAGKHQMPLAEFEKGLGAKVAVCVPFALDAYASATAGEVLVEKLRNSPAAKALTALAARFVQADKSAENGKPKGLFGKMRGVK